MDSDEEVYDDVEDDYGGDGEEEEEGVDGQSC